MTQVVCFLTPESNRTLTGTHRSGAQPCKSSCSHVQGKGDLLISHARVMAHAAIGTQSSRHVDPRAASPSDVCGIGRCRDRTRKSSYGIQGREQLSGSPHSWTSRGLREGGKESRPSNSERNASESQRLFSVFPLATPLNSRGTQRDASGEARFSLYPSSGLLRVPTNLEFPRNVFPSFLLVPVSPRSFLLVRTAQRRGKASGPCTVPRGWRLQEDLTPCEARESGVCGIIPQGSGHHFGRPPRPRDTGGVMIRSGFEECG